ncbi:MAG: MBL fold metallo-hydrolase [Galactobacter sp.]|uniref:MBL fold metallo-hydrolase n=1 Tax=Galactobacter sp. TaxID=2676125 RepID=UPI0025C59E49|nr:MBL fold metallo-hydrolase [Galactobacter sp.]
MTNPASIPDELIYSDAGLEVRRLSVSEMDNRCYLLTDTASGEQVLIDAADDPETLLAWAGQHGDGTLLAVLTTHSHWDHTRALAVVAESTEAFTISGEEDVDAIAEQRDVVIEAAVSHGEDLAFGDDGALKLTCVGLRGHTPGSIAYVLQRPDAESPAATLIFSGDSLFPGGVGNTDHDPARFASLLDDVTHRLFDVYPDSAQVFPGHGEGTTLGTERPHLEQWRERGW